MSKVIISGIYERFLVLRDSGNWTTALKDKKLQRLLPSFFCD